MYKKLLLFLIILCSVSLKAQIDSYTGENIKLNNVRIITRENVFESMDFECNPVVGLSIDDDLYKYWQPYSFDMCYVIRSDDHNFLTAMEFAFISRNFDYPLTKKMRNIYHFTKIKYHFINVSEKYDTNYMNKITIEDLKQNVHYCSVEYARETFNADTVICYNLPVKNVKSHIFTENNVKYDNCEVLALLKNDFGPVFFYCFYTKEGYKNRKGYMEKLKKSVRFKN
jgi:hypothetical protein